jgi:ABC-type lipoprotein export system ATPase subunit
MDRIGELDSVFADNPGGRQLFTGHRVTCGPRFRPDVFVTCLLTVVITVNKLTKSYLNGFSRSFVLRNIDLTVNEGEFVSIMGPSGSGKSTLLHILGMLDEPSTGEYFFFDQPVHKISERQRTDLHRQYIGFVFQAYHLIDDLTVYENLETPLLYKKIKGSERKSQVAEMLDRFNMVAKKDLFPSQLSGGQQQLVGVARALIMKPKLILADEPTGNLHTTHGEIVMDWFKRLNEQEGVTIIQVTHSEHWASWGKRIVELVDGRVERDEPTSDQAV